MDLSLTRTGKFLTALLAMFVFLSACKKKEEQPQPKTMPPQAVMQDKQQSVVVLPDSVKGKWKAVRISVLDKETGKRAEHEVGIGSESAVPGTGLIIKVDNFLPDFIMDGPVRTSASGEPNKPAAQISILEAGKEVHKGWLFYKIPSPHDFQHPRYSVSLAGFVPAGK